MPKCLYYRHNLKVFLSYHDISNNIIIVSLNKDIFNLFLIYRYTVMSCIIIKFTFLKKRFLVYIIIRNHKKMSLFRIFDRILFIKILNFFVLHQPSFKTLFKCNTKDFYFMYLVMN